MIVRTLEGLKALGPGAPPWSSAPGAGALDLYTGSLATYGEIYRTQPNVRTVVDFLARNIAELNFHLFRRLDDTDRVRLADHPMAQLLEKPNPATTRYRLFESTLTDYEIYLNAYWLKLRLATGLNLVRLPAARMSIEGNLLPRAFILTTHRGERIEFVPEDIVYFGGYHPDHMLMGLSPLETLRRILAEEAAAGDHRQAFWRNAGRFEGVIERPPTAPKWTKEQKTSWREQWQAAFGGGGTYAGAIAILEDGMQFKQTSWSAKDSEFTAARKLAREECASAYHVQLPFVGILDHATFSNIREQHRNLYQDTLGPTLKMLKEELLRQLLPEFDDVDHVYGEFNLREKLKGSFEEQATALQVLSGRPVMTANEARARLDLPRIDDDPSADQLASQQGGPADASAHPANPADPAPDPAGDGKATDDNDDEARRLDPTRQAVALVLRAHWTRQQAWCARRAPGTAAGAFNVTRWAQELTVDLLPILGERAEAYAQRATAESHARLTAGTALNDEAREVCDYA